MRPLTFRSKLLLWCALAVAVVASAFAVLPREPEYEGKSLNYWLDRVPVTFTAPNSTGIVLPLGSCLPLHVPARESDTAQQAVKILGSRGLPTLLTRLQKKKATMEALRLKLFGWQVKLHLPFHTSLASILMEPDIRRGQAVTALVLLGDTAKPVLQKVLSVAKSDSDPGIRASALEVLRHLSPADYAQVTGQTNVVSAAAR